MGVRPRLGAVDGHARARHAREGEHVVGQRQVPDGRVVVGLGPAAVLVDVVAPPGGTEVLGVLGELGDDSGQGRVGGVTGGLHAQHGGDNHLGPVPAPPVELRGGRPGEGEAGQVRGPAGVLPVHGVVQGTSQEVRANNVLRGSGRQRRGRDVGQDRPQGGRRIPGLRGVLAPVGQGEQVGALDVVQAQGPGQGVEDGVGGTPDAAALQARVVVRAHPRQRGHLLTAQARDAPVLPEVGQPDVPGRQPGPPGGQEAGDDGALRVGGHGVRLSPYPAEIRELTRIRLAARGWPLPACPPGPRGHGRCHAPSAAGPGSTCLPARPRPGSCRPGR